MKFTITEMTYSSKDRTDPKPWTHTVNLRELIDHAAHSYEGDSKFFKGPVTTVACFLGDWGMIGWHDAYGQHSPKWLKRLTGEPIRCRLGKHKMVIATKIDREEDGTEIKRYQINMCRLCYYNEDAE